MRARLHDEGGFTMLVVLGVLTVCAALTAVAFGAVVNDLPLRKDSRDRKAAYAAAEAGVNFYASRLNQDNEYWAKCTGVPAPNGSEVSPVNQRWDGAGADPRQSRVVPGGSSRYAVELLPVRGTQCLTSDPSGTMIDPTTGTMRIRATGFASCPSATSTPASCNEKRSIIATLRRKSFLDYLYFTDYETTDPALYGTNAAAAAQLCGLKYRASRSTSCSEISFSATDHIDGPLHTNDDLLTCDGTTFGRSAADRIEAVGAAPGYRNVCGSGAPNFLSTFQAGVQKLPVPESNDDVASVAVAPYILTGTNQIVFNDTTMTVTPLGKSSYTLNLPANGVISVQNGTGCGAGVSESLQDYSDPAGCANVYVSGRYAKSVTVVSDKDIVVNGNLTRASDDNLLGLIATNFVRVYHPVTNRVVDSDGTNKSCDSNSSDPLWGHRVGTMQDVQIDAAILTLKHSFVVDNYDCGGKLGTLTVNGAIAQLYRGPVGTSAPSGYTKDYNYDDRFKVRNPPSFLDPVAASWRILRTNEQVPAR